MEAQFWIERWTEGKTAFHKSDTNEKLVKHFPALTPKQAQKVLVPLCGKSKDLVWLHQLGLNVHGIELFQPAVEDFFIENKLQPAQKTKDPNFTQFTYENINISCGDFFKINASEQYDLIYDRAALVALPLQMRKDYAQLIAKVLKPGGKCLLIVYEYNQSELEGPPFSVPDDEIHSLYGDKFSIQLVEKEHPRENGSRLDHLNSLMEKVYILEKMRDTLSNSI